MIGEQRFSRPAKRAVPSRYLRQEIISSQLPINRWHELIGSPTLADTILRRATHNTYRIELSSESLSK